MANPIELIDFAVPSYFQDDYPRFIQFIKNYYEWLYRNGGFTESEVEIIKNEENWFIDNVDEYVRTKDLRYVSNDDPISQELAIIRASNERNPGKFSDEFMEKYHIERVYEFFETSDGEHFYSDDDETNGRFFDVARRDEKFLTSWLESLSFADPKTVAKTQDLDKFLLIRLLKYIYKVKGTKKAIELFFNIFLDVPVSLESGTLEVFLPKTRLSIIDDNFQPDGITMLRDDDYFNEYTYVIRIFDPTGVAQDLFNDFYYRYIHPAGFKAVILNTALNTDEMPKVENIIKSESGFMSGSILFTRHAQASYINEGMMIDFVGTGKPRFEHDKRFGFVRGVLFENESRNLFPNNTSLRAARDMVGVTEEIHQGGLSDQYVSLLEIPDSVEHGYSIPIVIEDGGFYKLSMFVKSNGRSGIRLESENPIFDKGDGTNRVDFDLSRGIVNAGSASDYAAISAYSDGWYRIEWGGISNVRETSSRLRVRLTENGTKNYEGEEGIGIFVTDTQLERMEYPNRASSLIRTGESQSSRDADKCQLMADQTWFNKNAGTFVFNVRTPLYTEREKILFEAVSSNDSFISIQLIESVIRVVLFDSQKQTRRELYSIEYVPDVNIKLAITYNNSGDITVYIDGYEMGLESFVGFSIKDMFIGNNRNMRNALEGEILNMDYYSVALGRLTLLPLTS